MANITDILSKILSARYGKDVRQSIHDGIKQCYDDGRAGSVDLYAREQLQAKASQKDLEFERARIDNLLKMPEGSTTADAALYDINIGYDGKDWGSPGNAVRGQVSQLSSETATLTQSKSDAITVEKSGTTIIATDSSDKGFEQFKTFGKSEQEKTSGKNFLRVDTESRTSKGVAIVVNADGSITFNGTAEADMDIRISNQTFPIDKYILSSGNKLPSNAFLSAYRTNGKDVAVSGNNAEVAISSEYQITMVHLWVGAGVTFNNLTIYPMLRKASITDATYEPYTGGQASPNPEYEQPIVSAGQKLCVGKNVFDIDADCETEMCTFEKHGSTIVVTTDSRVTNYGRVVFPNVSVDSNKTYTISFDVDSTEQIIVGWVGCSKMIQSSGLNHYTVTVSDVTTTAFTVGCTKASTTVKISNIQIEEGYVATSYEPYTAGVKKAVDVGIQKKLTGKNLLKNTAASKTENGITFTVDEVDRTATVNGTPTGGLNVYLDFSISDELEAGEYIFTCTPSTGSDKTYYTAIKDKNGGLIGRDTGSGISFTLAEKGGVNVTIAVMNGAVCNNLVFKPMIRYADVTDYTYEPYTEQTLTINRVLRGIPVTDASLANYTDENGQMWCADYADVERKVWVQRVKEVSFDDATWNFNADYNIWTCGYSNDAIYQALVCESVPFNIIGTDGGELGTRINVPYNIWVRNGSTTESPKGKAQYILATPIETPMTDEEIAAYDALHTNKPNTIITNDAGCFMVVKYVADTKAHIEQNYVPASKYTALEDRVSALERLHV